MMNCPLCRDRFLSRFSLPLFLTLLFVGAFGIRLAAVVALRGVHGAPSAALGADPVEFNSLGWHLAHDHAYEIDAGKPTSFRAPGFPLMLAGIYALAGQNYLLVYLALCGLGAISCVLTYLVAAELLDDHDARLAGVLAAIYFPHIYFATIFLSENLFVPCLALTAWLVLRHTHRGALAPLAIAGLFLGLSILTRPFALLLVPIVVLILIGEQWRGRGLQFPPIAALLLCTAVVVAPWTLRNYRVHHHAVLVATNGGSTFYGGNNDTVSSMSRSAGTWLSTRSLPGRDLIDATPDEYSHDQLEWQLGIQWLKQHPSRLAVLLIAKTVRLLLPDFDSSNRKYVLMNLVLYTPFLLLMMRGLFRCIRTPELRSLRWMLIHGTLLATLLTALIFWGSPRFRDANAPLLMIYATLGLGRRRSDEQGEVEEPVETARQRSERRRVLIGSM